MKIYNLIQIRLINKYYILIFLFLINSPNCFCDVSKNNTKTLKFYVSPNGNDLSKGTINKPWKSLEGAKNKIALINKTNIDTIITYFRDGNYFLYNTINFTISDGNSSCIIIYKNYPNEIPIFTSALKLKWELTNNILLNNEIIKLENTIYKAKVPISIKDIDLLLVNDKWMKRSRSEVFMPKGVENKEQQFIFMKIPNQIKTGIGISGNSYLSILPKQKWIHNILPIEEIDFITNKLKVSVPATYELDSIGFNSYPDGHAWIDNDPYSFDEPGEWYYNRTSNELYWWPKNYSDTDNVSVPSLTEFIKIEGIINYNGIDKTVKNIIFDGFIFTCGAMYHWQKDYTGWGLQHDWEMFDKPTALFRLRAAENCQILNSDFKNSAGAGIRIDLSGIKNTIANCTFSHLGGTAILLAGYGPGKKDVNKFNNIKNNEIQQIGKIIWHSPAIFIWQSGENLISHNYIHHIPYSAIVLSGRITWDKTGRGQCSKTIRWNEIEDTLTLTPDWYKVEKYLHARNNIVIENEIHSIMLFMGDGNAIYLSGAGKNNQILKNYIHHNFSEQINANIRSDDEQHESIINGNIIANTMAEGILIKGRCEIKNNIIYNLIVQTPNKQFSEYNRGYLVMPTGVVDNSIFKHNIIVSEIPNQTIHYIGKGKKLGTVVYANIKIDSNLYFNKNQENWTEIYFNFAFKNGKEINSIEQKVIFKDVLKHNFNLENKIFKTIDFNPDLSAIEYAEKEGHNPYLIDLWWPIVIKKKTKAQTTYKPINDLYLTE